MHIVRWMLVAWLLLIASNFFACLYGYIVLKRKGSSLAILRKLFLGICLEGAIVGLLVLVAIYRGFAPGPVPITRILGWSWMLARSYITYASWRFILYTTGRMEKAKRDEPGSV